MVDSGIYRTIIEQSALGFAFHAIITDDAGTPIDYTFLDVNPEFERITGLQREKILNRNVSEVLPGIRDGKFDWIGAYGDVANTGVAREFEQYSEDVKRHYRINVFSPRKGFFVTLFSDISDQVKIAEVSREILNRSPEHIDYQQITDDLMAISGAKFIACNRVLPNGTEFTTVALSGVPSGIRRGSELLGFSLEGKQWRYEPETVERIAGRKITRFANLNDLAGDVLPNELSALLHRSFHLGPVYIVPITKDSVPIGNFVLLMGRDEELRNPTLVEMYAGQIAVLLDRAEIYRDLKRTSGRLELAMDAGEHALWDWNLETGEVHYDRRYFTMLGYEPEGFAGTRQTWIDLMHPEDRERAVRSVELAIRSETNFTVEFRMKTSDDRWRWIAGTGKVVSFDDNGQPQRIVGIHTDIDERVKKDLRLIESEERYAVALSGSDSGHWDWDALRKTFYFSAIGKRLLGYGDDEIENSLRGWRSLWHPDEVTSIRRRILEFRKGFREQFSLEHRLRHKNGEWRWFLAKGKLSRGADDTLLRWTGTYVDITDRKNLEQRLAASERNFRAFFESTEDLILVASLQGTILYTNAKIAEVTGYTQEQLRGMHVLELHAYEDRDEARAILREMLAGSKESCHLPLEAKNGRRIPVETRTWYGEWDGTPCIFGSSRNLTDEQEANARFNTLFSRNPALMAVSTPGDRRFVEVNEAFLRKLGYSRDEVIGKTGDELGLFPRTERQKEAGMQLSESGSISDIELDVRRKDGTVLHGLFSGEIIESRGEPLFLTVMTDITTRKSLERALTEANHHLQEQSVLSRELASKADEANRAKSDFLASMSHEIRTPLNAIVGFSDLLLTTGLTGVQRHYLENVNGAAGTLLSVINEILDYSKIEAGHLELEYTTVDFRDLLEKAVGIVTYKAQEKGLELLSNIDVHLPSRVRADSVRLSQILTNLLSNAVKFTETGEVELRVRSTGDEPGTVEFKVRDTGIGLSPEQQHRIFDSFTQADISTTRVYGGTGLGLSIAKSLVEKMGGELRVESEPGVGSTFSFTASFLLDESAKRSETADTPSFTARSALIVDDNENNVEILRDMLDYWRIQTHTAFSGTEALEALKSGLSVDVIILDYHMPAMDGLTVAARIREELGIIAENGPMILLYTSADAVDVLDRCSDIGVYHRLIKPVRMAQLRETLFQIQEKDIPEIRGAEDTEVESRGPGEPVTILVAEDDATNRLLARGLLTKIFSDVTVVEATTGRRAVEKYTETVPDLVLMDVQMPELDGYAATGEIRMLEEQSGRSTPIIALTAGAFEGDREKCVAAGMNDYLAKPIMIESLREMVFQWLDPTTEDSRAKIQVARIRAFLGANGHSEDTIDAMFPLLREQIPEKVSALRKASAKDDFELLRSTAHSVKGLASTIGLTGVMQQAEMVEKAVMDGDMMRADELTEPLIRNLQRFSDHLRHFRH